MSSVAGAETVGTAGEGVVWLTVFKFALVVFLAVAIAVIAVVGRRRSRAHRRDPHWSPRNPRPGHEASVRGVMPTVPLPEWTEWDDHDHDDDPPNH
jgi:hypothetical protein